MKTKGQKKNALLNTLTQLERYTKNFSSNFSFQRQENQVPE